jgi:hypothetical protein
MFPPPLTITHAFVGPQCSNFSVFARYRHLELRARLTLLRGASTTEFAEKQNDAKLEIRVRSFF